jgi:hypothetical protein
MKNNLILVTTLILFLNLLQFSCTNDTTPLEPEDNQLLSNVSNSDDFMISASRTTTPPGIEVRPVYRVPTEEPGVFLTVFVFHERGGKKPKPPKGGGEQDCTDLNTNELYAELGPKIAGSGWGVEYHPAFEPNSVTGEAFDAIDNGFNTWEDITGDGLFNFDFIPTGSSPPALDNNNVIGWRLFTGRGGSFLAATWVWDDGANILETDIFYNLKHKWAVNPSIADGQELCGESFDVESIGVHEIGHMLGLGHVFPDADISGDERDATMAPTAAKGELKKQTLTPGDKDGADYLY